MADKFKINPFTGELDNVGSGFSIGSLLVGGTPGSILFIDSSGNLAQNNSQLYFNPTTTLVGIGTNKPTAKLEVDTDSVTVTGIVSRGFATNPVGTAPNLIFGLQAWFKADAITPVTDGTAISSWPDSSGNGNNAVQVTGSLQPKYYSNILNGLPAVLYDNVDDKMITTFNLATNTYSIFVVFNYLGSDTINAFAILQGDSSNGQVNVNAGSYNISDGNTTKTGPLIDPGAFRIAELITSAGTSNMYFEGAILGAATVGAGNFANNISIGNRTSLNFPMNGYMLEVIIYNTALSAADRQAVEKYLSNKWNIPTINSTQQTSRLLEIQSVDGRRLFSVDGAGSIYLATTTSTEGIIFRGQSPFLHSFGKENFFVGFNAGNFTLTSDRNVGIGSTALNALTSGRANLALGAFALSVLSTGSNNTAIGLGALQLLTTSDSNTAIGAASLQVLLTGTRDIAIGYNSAPSMITGDDNIAIGSNTLFVANGGNQNTAVGRSGLGSLTSGGNNSSLGYFAGVSGITTGSNNTYLGANAVPNGDYNFSTALGAGAIVGGSNMMVLGGTGGNAVKVGIGLTTPLAQLHMITDATTTKGLIVEGISSQTGVLFQLKGQSSVQSREQADFDTAWAVSTDATRKARSIWRVWDTAVREGMRIEASGSAPMMGFLGATAVIQQAGTGETVGFTAGTGTTVHDDSTFTGNVGATAYRISDIIKALKNYGLLAS